MDLNIRPCYYLNGWWIILIYNLKLDFIKGNAATNFINYDEFNYETICEIRSYT